MKKLNILLFMFVMFGATAQDVHFSQYFNAPLALNPAMTGLTNGAARVSVTYRNQWFSANTNGFFKAPYMTTGISGDMPIRIKKDVLGVGLFIANDQAGANTFTTVIAQANVAYIKTLGKKDNHRLSAGLQIGYTYQWIKTENFQFANQFQDNVFVASIPNNENITINKVGYLNMNFGLMYYGQVHKRLALFIGGSAYNVTTPGYNILPEQKRDLYWRWNAHGGLDIIIKKQFHILPTGIFMRQGVNDQLQTGIGFGFDFEKRYSRDNRDLQFTLGVMNRIHNITKGVTSDAIAPYFTFLVNGFKLGFSYDVTISKLKSAGSAVGALELMVGYTIKTKDSRHNKDLIVPRF